MASLDQDGKIFVGKSDKPEYLALHFGNRHGLVTGATGTGKTVTLQVLAEGFSRAGVPVFAADVKGDLSGIAAVGEAKEAFVKRAKEIGFAYEPDEFPVVFWDLFGEQGHPIRATVSEMGPLLLARLMDLNDTQEGVLNIAFRVADEQGLLLLDLKDLRALLAFVAENAERADDALRQRRARRPSAPSSASCWCWRTRAATSFFGEPALELADLMRTDRDGRGIINMLAADKLMQNPRLYATFLLWLLSELFEELPEVGDLDKPQARLLLRRGASAVRRRAQGAAGQGRAGGAADPLQGRRRLFRHAEPARRARQACWRSSATACSTRCAPSRRATRRR